MYGCESWTIKKAERQRTDAFKLWCWWRLLRIPWTARRSNQSILKEISPEDSFKELRLKLQYFGHLMRRADSLEKTLMLRKTEGKRRRGWQRMRWLESPTQWAWIWANSWSLLKFMSIESVMLSNHLILCQPLLFLPSIFPSIRVFPKSWLFASCGQILELQFQHQSFWWIFRFDFL